MLLGVIHNIPKQLLCFFYVGFFKNHFPQLKPHLHSQSMFEQPKLKRRNTESSVLTSCLHTHTHLVWQHLISAQLYYKSLHVFSFTVTALSWRLKLVWPHHYQKKAWSSKTTKKTVFSVIYKLTISHSANSWNVQFVATLRSSASKVIVENNSFPWLSLSTLSGCDLVLTVFSNALRELICFSPVSPWDVYLI